MEELFSDRNGDGVFREENTMLPMLAIAVTVAIWTPINVVACKWIADDWTMASGSLMPAEGVSETG